MLKFDMLSPFLQKTGTPTQTQTHKSLGGSEEREMDGSEKQSHGAEHTESYRWTEILMQSQAQGGKTSTHKSAFYVGQIHAS